MHIKTNMTDVETLRKQARQNIDNGAVTAGYADLMLNLPIGEQHSVLPVSLFSPQKEYNHA